MTALVRRTTAVPTWIAALFGSGGSGADGSTTSEGKDGRLIGNAVLLAIVWTLALLWFTAHVKPYVNAVLFGSVSLATLGLTAAAVFFAFVKREDALTWVGKKLRTPSATAVLVASLPIIAFAFLTTFTLNLTAGGDIPEVRLLVKNGTSSKPITLTPAQKQRSVSYFFAFRPVTAHIETLSPSGFNARELPLRRGIPAELIVPDRSSQKSFSLVRLMPLYKLFQLRGRREPDPRYVVRVYVPGVPKPIEHSGLTFGAIYLGASLPDLQAQSKVARSVIADLRNTLHGLDGEMKAEEIDEIVADWLDDPKFIPTPELKPGDQVRVVLESPAGKSELTVRVNAPVNTAFLSAPTQGGDE